MLHKPRPWLFRDAATKHGLRSAVACAALIVATPAFAQAPAPATGEDAKRALEQSKTGLSTAESKAKALQSDLTEIDAERERLNMRLQETAALVQRSEAKLTSIEGRMSELEAQEMIVRGTLGQRHGQIAQLLAALQRMGRNPPPVLITRREDALKMVRSAMLLSSAFPELKGQALSLAQRLEDLVRVIGDIRTEGERLQAETDRLNEARTRLASLMDAKKLTLADRQSELAAVQTASAEYTKSVTDLTDLIAKFDQTVTEKTGLGVYQNELKSSAATPSAASAITPVPVTENDATGKLVVSETSPDPANSGDVTKESHVAALSPPPRLKPPIVELAPSQNGIGLGNPGRMRPAIPFAAAQTKLPLPVQGRRVLAFGERTQYGGQSKGIVVETRQAAQVIAPCDGWVVYAGEFRSYGQLLIINTGDGYHMLLAGMSQIDVQPGQFVLTSEPVGSMSGTPKTSPSSVPSNAPVLYVELRKDGRPIDPDPWWVPVSQQKVQG